MGPQTGTTEALRVFIVDDEPMTARLLSILLELEGHQPRIVNGVFEEVWEEILAGQPDLLLVDMYLRWGEGLDLLKAARIEERLRRTTFLLVSALDRSEECLKAGADGFLLKPFNRAELLEAMDKARQRHERVISATDDQQ
jgi:two-component system response regulator AlgR